MNELALFAGAGGGILGGHLLGWRTVCAVEWKAYPASVLVARQNDKILPPFPIWDDVQTFDGKPWREMARIIGEVRPRYVFVENSPMLTSRGLGTVLRDLAQLGYDAEWGVLGADDVGANHHRKRIWLLAYSDSYSNIKSQPTSNGTPNQAERKSRTQHSSTRQSCGTSDVFRTDSMQEYEESNILAYTNSRLEQTRCKSRVLGEPNSQRQTIGYAHGSSQENVGDTKSTRFSPCELGQRKIESWRTSSRNSQWWEFEPNVDRVADGVAARVDRLKAIGNGQVPLCAATAWNILKGRIDEPK